MMLFWHRSYNCTWCFVQHTYYEACIIVLNSIQLFDFLVMPVICYSLRVLPFALIIETSYLKQRRFVSSRTIILSILISLILIILIIIIIIIIGTVGSRSCVPVKISLVHQINKVIFHMYKLKVIHKRMWLFFDATHFPTKKIFFSNTQDSILL